MYQPRPSVCRASLSRSWFVLLLRALQYVAAHREEIGGRVPGFYDDIRWLLLVFQTAALLEVKCR